MIDALADSYPGHRVLEFFATVATAVTLVTALAWTVSFFLPRRPAARHGVLLSGLLASLAGPIFALAFIASGRSLIRVPLLSADATIPPLLSADAEKLNGDAAGFDGQRHSAPGRSGAIDQRPVLAEKGVGENRLVPDPAASPAAPIRSAAVAVLLIWLCGTVIGILALVRSVFALLRLRRSVQPLCDPAVDRALVAVRTHLKRARSTEITISALVRAPLATGLMRPVVILPATLIESISPAQLREVLLHELAHIERRDNLVALAQLVARSLFWPIPFVHLLNRQLERAREEVCDNYVLGGSDALTYGETLLRVASLAWCGAMPAATVGILHWRGKLEDRIAGLIDTRRNKVPRMHPLLAVAIIVAFLSAGAILCGTTIVQADQGDNPPAKAKSADVPPNLNPAPAAPAAAKTDRAAPGHDKPSPYEEAERRDALGALAEVYALKPGEVLKCITPPFPSDRDFYLDKLYPRIPQAAQSLNGYVWMNFTWNNGLKYKNGIVHSAPAGLGRRVLDVLTGLLDCPEQEIEGDQAILTKGIAADFVARDGASPEQVVARLGEVFKEEFKLPVKISIKDEEREVFVVRGKCKPGADRVEVYGYKIIDPNKGGGGEGSFREMLGHVGDWIKCRIVSEVEDAPKQVSWHFNWRAPYTKELLAQDQDPQSVMKHLAEQLGLTVNKQRRTVRVFRVEAVTSE